MSQRRAPDPTEGLPRLGLPDDDDDDAEATKVGTPAERALATSRDRAYLIVLAGSNVGQMWRIAGHEMVIGRSADAMVRIHDDNISRRHARLYEENGRLHIEDLGSANGTRVNGAPVETRALADGDKVELGSTTVLKFTYHDELDEQFQRSMYDAAQRDSLTKAFNKRYFLDRLASEVAYARRHGLMLSLLMIDADHFKRVNDTYGHLAGDGVLVRIAQIVQSAIRTEDVFARYGGEEFAVICRGVARDGAAILAERLRVTISQTAFEHGSGTLPVTVSIGVSGLEERVVTVDDLVQGADEALYAAKRGGRNRVVRHGVDG